MDMTRKGVATENVLQKNLSYYLDVRLEISTLRKRKLGFPVEKTGVFGQGELEDTIKEDKQSRRRRLKRCLWTFQIPFRTVSSAPVCGDKPLMKTR